MKYIPVLMFIIFLSQASAQWRTVGRITTPYVYAFHFSGNNVYTGTGDSLYISRDKGETWEGINFLTKPPYTITALTEYNNILYAGSYEEGVFKSTDDGITWQSFNEGLSGWGLIAYGFHLSGDTLIMITDGGGVYLRRLSSAENWKALNNNLPDNYAWTVHDICETSQRYIIGAGASGYFFVYPRGGSGWQEKQIEYNGKFYPTPTALISHNDTILAGNRFGIFRSTDHGDTWDSVGIKALPLGTVSFTKNGNRIYAGLTNSTDFWVWYTDDLGSTWNILDHQFAQLNELYCYDNKLWAATNSGAMISNPLISDVPGTDPVPASFLLEQNYPNPFNPSTTITYSIPGGGHAQVILKVFDMLGREITTLVDEMKQPGKHHVNFSAPGLSSGVYYYTLNVSGINEARSMSRKMIFMK
jgi:photosystem II stability/assembly factor-like uncharacterized protein